MIHSIKIRCNDYELDATFEIACDMAREYDRDIFVYIENTNDEITIRPKVYDYHLYTELYRKDQYIKELNNEIITLRTNDRNNLYDPENGIIPCSNIKSARKRADSDNSEEGVEDSGTDTVVYQNGAGETRYNI